jgi:hypothetical protein
MRNESDSRAKESSASVVHQQQQGIALNRVEWTGYDVLNESNGAISDPPAVT